MKVIELIHILRAASRESLTIEQELLRDSIVKRLLDCPTDAYADIEVTKQADLSLYMTLSRMDNEVEIHHLTYGDAIEIAYRFQPITYEISTHDGTIIKAYP